VARLAKLALPAGPVWPMKRMGKEAAHHAAHSRHSGARRGGCSTGPGGTVAAGLEWLGAGGVVRVLDGGGCRVAHRWLETWRPRSGEELEAWRRCSVAALSFVPRRGCGMTAAAGASRLGSVALEGSGLR
jgi:hypothetical protein